MTTRYRVEYALKTHRRDQFIEWIKGLLAVPFVLHSQPTPTSEGQADTLTRMADVAHRRYAEIFHDVQDLINDHIAHQRSRELHVSKLKHLVPSIGSFFTPLALEEAFEYQDKLRRISSRRFVAPSFNDVRLILNSAQILSLSNRGDLKMITFDGDLTLYDDGNSLVRGNPVIDRIMRLLWNGYCVGIVTAAGYAEPVRYQARLQGLLVRIYEAEVRGLLKKPKLVVVGGESNYLLAYDSTEISYLKPLPRHDWLLPEMRDWGTETIRALLDLAEKVLRSCIDRMDLPAEIARKDRAVGIIPSSEAGARKFNREQLEETVLATQQVLESSSMAREVPFCAFNGGNDVFVDIGDKSWGVRCCQRYFGGIPPEQTLHVGDQFLSAGSNDFKARSACTTAWIAGPAETVALLDEVVERCGLREFGL